MHWVKFYLPKPSQIILSPKGSLLQNSEPVWKRHLHMCKRDSKVVQSEEKNSEESHADTGILEPRIGKNIRNTQAPRAKTRSNSGDECLEKFARQPLHDERS